jgi:hypothetical protein
MNSPKYNRTPHLPWSPGGTSEDKRAKSIDSLLNIPLVITEKLDGSNVSLEKDGCYARTHAGTPTHASFDGFKALHASIKYTIYDKVQLFGEWCYALHSIAYTELPNYLLLFGVRYLDNDGINEHRWGSWSSIESWAGDIGVATVPLLWTGYVSSEKALKNITEDLVNQPSTYGSTREGVVVRVATSFPEEEFSSSVMKWVRKDHVNPNNDHWKHQEIIKNSLYKK